MDRREEGAFNRAFSLCASDDAINQTVGMVEMMQLACKGLGAAQDYMFFFHNVIVGERATCAAISASGTIH